MTRVGIHWYALFTCLFTGHHLLYPPLLSMHFYAFTMVSCSYLSLPLFYLPLYIFPFLPTDHPQSLPLYPTEGKSCLYLFHIMLLTITYYYSYLSTIGVYYIVVIRVITIISD